MDLDELHRLYDAREDSVEALEAFTSFCQEHGILRIGPVGADPDFIDMPVMNELVRRLTEERG